MKKLDDIPKKDFFTAPEGYFDELPMRVARRVESVPPRTWLIFRYSLYYALPALLLTLGVLWYVQPQSPEELLADVPATDLLEYLAETELEYDEFVAEVNPDEEEVSGLEQEVFDLALEPEDINALINELDDL